VINYVRTILCMFFLLGPALVPASAIATPPDSLAPPAGKVPWGFSLAGYYYAVPDEDGLLMAVARADRGSLHLEARYNYEDMKTASVFAGWNFSAGESFAVDLTPMAGAAFGNTSGILAGLEASLGYGMLDFYAETEYLYNLEDRSENFLYSWLELAVTPTALFRAGLTAQRLRVFQTPLGIERGVFAQVMPGLVSVSAYVFNPLTESWYVVVGLVIEW